MSIFDRRLVALDCQLAPGAFSGERIFEVELADGSKYRSLAPRQFCWVNGKLVGVTEPATETAGLVAAKVVDQTEDGQVIVEVPDGEVIAVDAARVKDRPTEIRPPEPKPHVPVGS
ncbi:MAG TPA: hypothetical protein VKA46_41910 [Gemmataceae bacterium]|nr:hypothetical protein [Gemmataceae bacterium]